MGTEYFDLKCLMFAEHSKSTFLIYLKLSEVRSETEEDENGTFELDLR